MTTEEKKHASALPASMMRHWYNDTDYSPDAPWKSFDPRRSALVLVDLINWQADPQGASIQSVRAAGKNDHADYIVKRCAELLIPNLGN